MKDSMNEKMEVIIGRGDIEKYNGEVNRTIG